MEQSKTIQDIVTSTLQFKFGVAANGWHRIYCSVCGDGKRTKGPRGGWLFNDEMCFFHCFNCGVDGNFDPNRDQPFSKDMRKIFESFGIPKGEYTSLLFKKPLHKTELPKSVIRQIKTLDIPNHFYELSTADIDNLGAIRAREYLISRHIDPDSYPFYLSTGLSTSPNPQDIAKTKFLTNRLIIPSFKNNEMVYYQARSLDSNSKIKYVNADSPRGNIIYGFDKLYSNVTSPLFITEGFFDAHHLNGVAVLENKMSTAQIEILEKSPRVKVIVPDRGGDSVKLAEQGIDLGWGVAIPDIGSSCKDIDEAINKYGKLYVLDSVMQNIKYGIEAKFIIRQI